MKQKAKFFCENCGAEVPEKARVCQHCGKFFASVRCPMCGTIGSVSQFTHGCPQCGYARTGTTAPARPRRLHRPHRCERQFASQLDVRDCARRLDCSGRNRTVFSVVKSYDAPRTAVSTSLPEYSGAQRISFFQNAGVQHVYLCNSTPA